LPIHLLIYAQHARLARNEFYRMLTAELTILVLIQANGKRFWRTLIQSRMFKIRISLPNRNLFFKKDPIASPWDSKDLVSAKNRKRKYFLLVYF
jgi:hypothetical protein